jgi:hypothetical protein
MRTPLLRPLMPLQSSGRACCEKRKRGVRPDLSLDHDARRLTCTHLLFPHVPSFLVLVCLQRRRLQRGPRPSCALLVSRIDTGGYVQLLHPPPPPPNTHTGLHLHPLPTHPILVWLCYQMSARRPLSGPAAPWPRSWLLSRVTRESRSLRMRWALRRRSSRRWRHSGRNCSGCSRPTMRTLAPPQRRRAS